MQWMTMTSFVPCHALHAPQLDIVHKQQRQTVQRLFGHFRDDEQPFALLFLPFAFSSPLLSFPSHLHKLLSKPLNKILATYE